MKLPYHVGDSFELPLGTGESTPATIAACHHHFVDVTVAGRTLRVFDDALVLHRWQATPSFDKLRMTRGIEVTRTLSPARAERTIAAQLGVASFDDVTHAVYEMHDEITTGYLATLPPAALLAWRRPLAVSTLDRLRALAAVKDVRLRLQDAAAVQALAFADMPVRDLTIAGSTLLVAPFPHVDRLTIDAPLEQHTLAEMFPNVTTLRVTAGAECVDFRAIARMTRLEHLNLSHVSSPGETLDQLEPLRNLRALRVARLDDLRSLRGLDRFGSLRTLSIEHLLLDTLAPLPRCESLEQLELHGMWQFAIDDATWLHNLPKLVRAEIDIGGRRKNLELYRRARWAYPWPTF